MKSWYDKKGRYCYGRARGGIKAALKSYMGYATNSHFVYVAEEDAGGIRVWRWRAKKDGAPTGERVSVYYRAYGD